MKQTKQKNKERNQQFNPRIIVGIVGAADLETLNEIKDFFQMLDGYKLIYLRTSGFRYVTDKKPCKEHFEGG